MGILDWGGGNLGSVERAFRRAGADAVLASGPAGLAGCDGIVFPGVGSFGDVMEGLRSRGLDAPLLDAVRAGRPVLGICVGLQALFDGSDESPGVAGLGILPGSVRRLPGGGVKVPQIGWNRVEPANGGAGGAVAAGHYYFANAYFAEPADRSVAAAWTDHGVRFASAVAAGSLIATQFHPEKSGSAGIALLRRWLAAGRA